MHIRYGPAGVKGMPSYESQLHFRIQNVSDVSESRRKGMQLALDIGFAHADATKIAVVISELARNILVYADEGTITIFVSEEASRKYIKIVAVDEGPGIPHIEQALADGFSTSGGLGLGLSGSRRLVDDFSIQSELGKGTQITAVKWLK